MKNLLKFGELDAMMVIGVMEQEKRVEKLARKLIKMKTRLINQGRLVDLEETMRPLLEEYKLEVEIHEGYKNQLAEHRKQLES